MLIIVALWWGIQSIPVRSLPPLLSNYVGYLQEKGRDLDDFLLNTKDTFLTISKLRDRKAELEKAQLLTKTNTQLVSALEYENLQLRRMLWLSKRSPFVLVTAQVIARSAESWFSYLTINRGIKDGIKQNMVVLNENGLVGRIVDVDKDYSKVLTITSPLSKVSIVDAGTGTLGIAIGKLHRPLTLSYIANASHINEGDQVLTSGISYIFPKGLMVGTVKKVKKEKYSIFQKVDVAPAVDFSKLQYVFIITGRKQ